MKDYIYSPLVGDGVIVRSGAARIVMFALWAVLVAWFLSGHVFWRDEIRAYSLALSGSGFLDMLRNVQGEGHPALWYLILRGAHELFPYREVLPVAGAVIGISAMATFAAFSPFRSAIVALVLFSAFGAFEYVVVARNYGMAAVVMFAIAGLYNRINNSLWLGVLIALLANTNVPSCILAGCFLLFRFVEIVNSGPGDRRVWKIFLGNAALALVGALICFRTVYPTFNDAAVSSNLDSPGLHTLVAALADTKLGFHQLGQPVVVYVMILGSLLAFLQRPAALIAAAAGFLSLKIFFYAVYLSYYRHEALFIVFLIALHWMVAKGAGGDWLKAHNFTVARVAGQWAFIFLLSFQTILTMWPIRNEVRGIPYSRSADAAALLQRPDLRGAILMSDTDTMLEPFPYYVDNPIWLLRDQRFGKVSRLSKDSRLKISLDDVLADAARLHRETGRPIVYLSYLKLDDARVARRGMIYYNVLHLTPENLARFRKSTRLVARLRRSGTGEGYEVYRYPR